MGVKWVGSGRGTSILCQDDQLGTPEVLGPILAKKSLKKQGKTENTENPFPIFSPPPHFSGGNGCNPPPRGMLRATPIN